MLSNRIFQLNNHKFDDSKNTIVYWITREFRSSDNWSLVFSQKLANKHQKQLIVLINLLEESNIDYIKPFNFFIEGLFELKENLSKLNIPLHISYGKSSINIPNFLDKVNAGALVTDFFPLKYYQKLANDISNKIEIPIYEIDSHNIVPCRIASQKLEYAAYTIRPKINRLIPEYLIEIPKIEEHIFNNQNTFDLCQSNFEIVSKSGIYNKTNSTKVYKSGEKNANLLLDEFISKKLQSYSIDRNNPNYNLTSGLSPYIHFGQISTQRIALEVCKSNANQESIEVFLEELIVRRELSDNFCLNNSNYDNFEGFHPWAKQTLNEHRKDKREYVYQTEQFEFAKTHDLIWNAAQNEMIQTGKMHGYMRMYWAKKILEWTESPEEALAIGIYLNDKYSLDGYDPNGYVGLAWSIGGVHDRAWQERQVFGKIRFMNYAGLKRKFDTKAYEQKWNKNSLF